MRRALFVLLLAVALAGVAAPTTASVLSDAAATASAVAPAVPSSVGLRAGVGVADFSWHVGSGSGQHSTEGNGTVGVVTGDPVDPYAQTTKQQPSSGIQSRLSARALVFEGSNGERVALVKTDNYLAQDLLVRRAAQLIDPALRLPHDRIVMSATHNHNSPYFSSPAAGVWVFQDVWDVRAFEYQARQIAEAITDAATSMRPARLGATTVDFPGVKGNVAGRGASSDRSPYGYPRDFGDHGVVVLRVDDVSGKQPVPLATWTNFGQHPESLSGYDLVSADFVGPFERFVDRETGATLVYTQGDVGSSEGPSYDGPGTQRLPDGSLRAWYHTGFAQSERFARLLADAVVAGWRQIGDGNAQIPFTRDVPVSVFDAWVPGPVSHPYPAANACSTDPTL
ncbi:MAG TPA: neutral/alkaline non-lysosomal ceramidase N-terminal domain-containing protein, partial [Acidimicrobiales bacterium]